MHKTKVSTHAAKPKKHNHDMDKVKIKRVKRNTKIPTTGEKVLGAVGLASTLLGGASAISPKAQNTQIVRTQTEESPKSSSIKDALKNIFGIEEARAYSDEEGQEEGSSGVSEIVPEDTFMDETVTTEILKPEGEVSESVATEEVSLPEDTSGGEGGLVSAGTVTTSETENIQESTQANDVGTVSGQAHDMTTEPGVVNTNSGFVTNTPTSVVQETSLVQEAEASPENLGLDVWTNQTTGEQSAYVSGYGIVTYNPSSGSYTSQSGQQVTDPVVARSFAEPGSVQVIQGTEQPGLQNNNTGFIPAGTRTDTALEIAGETGTGNSTGFVPSGTRTATAIATLNQTSNPSTPAPFTPTYIQGVTVNNANDGSSQAQNSNQFATLETAQYYARLLGGTVEAINYNSGPFSLSAPQYQIRVGNTLLNAGLVADTFQKNGEKLGMIQIQTDIATSSGQIAPTWNQVADTLNSGGSVYGVNNAPPASATPTASSPTIPSSSNNNWIVADAAYWAKQPAAVQQLQGIEDLEARKALAENLAKQGYTIDVPIMVWQWSPTKTAQLRQDYGYTWVPSALQENVQIAPGLSVPGSNLKPYDPNNAPAGSIAVVGTGANYTPPVSGWSSVNNNQSGSGTNTGGINSGSVNPGATTAPAAVNVVVTQVLAGSQFNQLSPYSTQIKTGDYIELKGNGFEDVKSVSLVAGNSETVVSTVKSGSSIQFRVPSLSVPSGAAISVRLTLKNNSVRTISTVLKFTVASTQSRDALVHIPAPSESPAEVLYAETKSVPVSPSVSPWVAVSQDSTTSAQAIHDNVQVEPVVVTTPPANNARIDKVELVSFPVSEQSVSEGVVARNEHSIPFFNNGVISSLQANDSSVPMDKTIAAAATAEVNASVVKTGTSSEGSSNALVAQLQTQVTNLQNRIHTLESKLSETDQPSAQLTTQIAELKTQAEELKQTVASVSDWTPVMSSIAMPKFGTEIADDAISESPIAQNTTYIVKKGDTLWSIAKRVYGEGRKWRKILSANTKVIKDPNSLKMGMELTIPKIDN